MTKWKIEKSNESFDMYKRYVNDVHSLKTDCDGTRNESDLEEYLEQLENSMPTEYMVLR